MEEEDLLLAQEEDLLLAQEGDLLLAQEEDLLLAQEEDLLLVQYMKHENKHIFLVQYMKHESKKYVHGNKKYVLQKRSARKFCADFILDPHKMIGNRSSYDKFRF